METWVYRKDRPRFFLYLDEQNLHVCLYQTN